MRSPARFLLLTGIIAAGPLPAQVSAPSGQKSLAATINVYVFPNAGQSASQQNQDEGECFGWAKQNTGVDPFQLAQQNTQQQAINQQNQQQAQQAGSGTVAKGAVGGAAAGALIGAIAGDAGKGAVWGVGAGLLGGGYRRMKQKEEAEQQATQQAQTAAAVSNQDLGNFKKAFGVCLQAKKYMVEY